MERRLGDSATDGRSRNGQHPPTPRRYRHAPAVTSQRDFATPTPAIARRGPRRLALVGASAAAVFVLAAATACAGIGGVANTASTPTPAAGSSSPTVAGSSAPASSPSVAAGGTAIGSGSSNPQPVLGMPHAAPLPDNVLLATRVVNGSEDLYQIDAVTGAVGKKLTNGATGPQYAIFSPDRGTIVYMQLGEHQQLRTMAADGAGDRELFSGPLADCVTIPAWNPVEPSVLALRCVRDGKIELNLVNVDGTVRSTINTGIPNIDDVSYSPDGKSIMYWGTQNPTATGGALYIQPADGSGIPRQVTTPGDAGDADATFSSDGKTIVFRRANSGTAAANSAQILTVQTDGSGLRPVTDGTAYDEDPTISPDGTQVAFKSNRNNAAGTSERQIWVIGLDGTGLRQLGIGSPGIADGAPAWGHR